MARIVHGVLVGIGPDCLSEIQHDDDLASAVIRVNRSWDRLEGRSHEGLLRSPARPIGGTLRDFLAKHRAGSRLSDDAEGLAFGRTQTEAFEPSTLSDSAAKAWSASGLLSITLHEARHTYASLMAAAGIQAGGRRRLHGPLHRRGTRSLYRHLYPCSRRRAAEALERFFGGAGIEPTKRRAAPPRRF